MRNPSRFPAALVQDPETGDWWSFENPIDIFVISRAEDVLPALTEIERSVEQNQLWAAGFISYEAGPAFDPAIRAHAPDALPLMWMALFPAPRLTRLSEFSPPAAAPAYQWSTSMDEPAHARAIREILALIDSGDTYQVNYTLRLHAAIREAPEALFLRMIEANRPRHGAYLDCGRFVICSASPELFFDLRGERLASRPMKGTGMRGLWPAQDAARKSRLAASAKDRAENVMIVDMVRNDLGRIAVTGSVGVEGLFELERYPTVWQMTSTVSARTRTEIADIFKALFPAASITGAPKVRASEIITALETSPRGVYTGSIGYLAPGRRACFNVAIRTAVVDRDRGTIIYGTGSGIVRDSTAATEYAECLLKARIVTAASPPYSLLETLLWEPDNGFLLLEEHLQRLAASAEHLDFPVDLPRVRQRLDALAAGLPSTPQRVRLLLARDGSIRTEAAGLRTSVSRLRLGLAATPIDKTEPFLYHKTTQRTTYETARASRPDCDDVVLWNANGEITETSIANLVAEVDGKLLTPPVECGLLPGVFRGWLLSRGEIEEHRITLDDLRRAKRIFAVNSVRRWQEAGLVG